MSDSSTPTPRPLRNAILTIAALWALFLAAALPLILIRYDCGRGAYDQEKFHLPVIRQFIREWPRPDLHDYPSATTPGYHVIVAAIARATGLENEQALRCIGALFTLGLLATVGMIAGRAGAMAGIVICLPMVASLYVFSAGTWILPDNSGWWTLLLAMLLALRSRTDPWTIIGAAMVILAVATMRQVNIWIIAPMVVSAWISDSAVIGREGGMRGESANDVTRNTAPHPNPLPRLQGRGSGAAILMLVAALPGIGVLLYFFHLWHGLVPPNQRQFIGGGNLAAVPGVLSDIGALGFFYLPFLVRRDKLPTQLWQLALGAMAGAALAMIPPTTHDQPAGRYSGLWNIQSHVPILFGRSSLLIVGASAMGGGILLAWLWSFPHRQRLIWGTAAIAFIIAQTANHNAFYRYYEPVILIAAVMTVARLTPRASRAALIGPVLLTLLLAAVTVWSLLRAPAA